MKKYLITSVFLLAVLVAPNADAQSTSLGLYYRIKVTPISIYDNYVNVRNSPGGTFLGTQARDSVGTIIDGPAQAWGFTWWKVHFDYGVDGWVVQRFLNRITTPLAIPTVTPSQITANSGQTVTLNLTIPSNALQTTVIVFCREGITITSPGHTGDLCPSNRGLTFPILTRPNSLDITLSSTSTSPVTPHLVVITVQPDNLGGLSYTGTNSAQVPITINPAPLQPSLTITSPNGRETYTKGTSLTMRWTGRDLGSEKVRVSLRDSSMVSRVIQNDVSATGDTIFGWMIPADFPIGSYKVVVETRTGVRDTSDNYFSITSVTPTTQPSITVNIPPANTTWFTGTIKAIVWNSGLITVGSPLNIYLIPDCGSTSCTNPARAITTVNSTGDSGSYSWNIPTTIAEGNYRIRINSGSLRGESQVFAIRNALSPTTTQPSLTVLSPNGGEVFTPSASSPTMLIRWINPEGFTADNSLVTINSCTVGTLGTVCPPLGSTNIVSGLRNTGEFRATIMTAYGTPSPAGQYVINIRATRSDGQNASDSSDKPHTITTANVQNPTISTVQIGTSTTPTIWTNQTTKTINWSYDLSAISTTTPLYFKVGLYYPWDGITINQYVGPTQLISVRPGLPGTRTYLGFKADLPANSTWFNKNLNIRVRLVDAYGNNYQYSKGINIENISDSFRVVPPTTSQSDSTDQLANSVTSMQSLVNALLEGLVNR